MEKSNLPLPLKKGIVVETISSVPSDASKVEKRTTTIQSKHGLVREGSGRVLKERPQFGGSYLKKRLGYSSRKAGVSLSLKGSKAVVTSLCAAGDFADTCFPGSSESRDSVQLESAGVKRGALSMKSKLIQLQERNRLILAKHQFPRTSSSSLVHTTPQVIPDLTSAMLMTPLTLSIETTTDEEAKTCNEQMRNLHGDSCSTSPIYHELDPIDVHQHHVSSSEQHTYQSISEVREEMARLLQAQTNLRKHTIFDASPRQLYPPNNCLKISELSARESQKRIYETSTAVQESEPKQNRSKRSIFSKFWLSRRNLLSTQEVMTSAGDGKAVLTSMTSLHDDEITTPHTAESSPVNNESGVGLRSPTQSSSALHFMNYRKHPTDMTALSNWNAYSNYPSSSTSTTIDATTIDDDDLHNNDNSCQCCQGFYIPTDSSFYSNARGSYSNRDDVGNPYDCYYGWKSDEEVQSDVKTGPTFKKTLQSFAKRSVVGAEMKSKTKASEEYFSSIEMANALTEYHWNIYQTANINQKKSVETPNSIRRADDISDALSKDTTRVLHEDQWVTSHFLPIQLTPDQSKASEFLDPSAVYTHRVDAAFLHSPRPATATSFFRGKKMSRSQFSSPSCGVRMAEMRQAVRRKSEGALLFEQQPSAQTLPCSTADKRRTKEEEEMLHHPTALDSSPCVQNEAIQVSRNMQTILEEDQMMMENVTSCSSSSHIAAAAALLLLLPSSPETDTSSSSSSTGLSKHSESRMGMRSNEMDESTLDNQSTDESDSLSAEAESTIHNELLPSDDGDGGGFNDYEKKSGDLTYAASSSSSASSSSQTKQSTQSKTKGSRLKKPKPLKHCNASTHSKSTSNAGDCSLALTLSTETQQNTSSSKARKPGAATSNTPLLFNSNRTTEREPKPHIRHAVIRQIESVSSAQADIRVELLESSHQQRTLKPTPRLKSGSCIPRTKNLSANRTYSADEKSTHKNICLHENVSVKKRVDFESQKKHLNDEKRSLEEATGLLTFSRSQSADVAFKQKEAGEHLRCLYSHDTMSNSETMSNRSESMRTWADQTPEVVVNCPNNLECRGDQKQNTPMSMSPGEYHISEISSLSSSLTSSNSSGSVFVVTESESESPTTSSSTRDDLQLSLESPSSSTSSSCGRRVEASVTIPAEDSASKDAELTAAAATKTKPKRGKSQLLAPRTDATRCLERLERLRIETKQTKNEFHQKLRH